MRFEDMFLVFADEAEANAAFAGLFDVNGNLMCYTHDYAIDVIGDLNYITWEDYTDPETEDFDRIPTIHEIPGWHVNVRALTPQAKAFFQPINAQYGVSPTTPRRVFAGKPSN